MTKSEVALKMMELLAKNAGNYKLECINSIYFIHLYNNIIEFTHGELKIGTNTGTLFIRTSLVNIYSINIYDTYAIFHLLDGTILIDYEKEVK